MKLDNAEKRIKDAYQNIAPEIMDSILSDCQDQKGEIVIMKTKKNNIVKRIAAIAACFIIVAGGAFGLGKYGNVNKIMSSIMLDINPSIQIDVNAKEKVLGVQALNEDAKTVIGDMDFKGSNLDVTINAIIGSLLRNGYISDESNSILVSVNSKDIETGKNLETKLIGEIDRIISAGNVAGAVLGQVISESDEVSTSNAEKYGITPGKAALIEEIVENNNTYKFEDLVSLSINELNIISESKGQSYKNIETVGESSTSRYIGKDKAEEIVFKHANVNRNDIYDYESDMDWENGHMVYEISFACKGYEYDYEVNATSGEIEKKETEIADHYIVHDPKVNDNRDSHSENSNGGKSDTKSGKSSGGKSDTNSDTNSGKTDGGKDSGNSGSVPNAGDEIGKDKAKSIALSHAGLNAQNVSRYEIERDRENGRVVYEISFECGGYEYDYEINALTGDIIDYEKEYDD